MHSEVSLGMYLWPTSAESGSVQERRRGSLGSGGPTIEIVVGLAMLLFELAQLCSLAFTKAVPWSSSHLLSHAFPPLKFDFSRWMPGALSIWLLFANGSVAVFLYGLLFALAPSFKSAEPDTKKKVIMWPMAIFFCWAVTTIAFIPAVSTC